MPQQRQKTAAELAAEEAYRNRNNAGPAPDPSAHDNPTAYERELTQQIARDPNSERGKEAARLLDAARQQRANAPAAEGAQWDYENTRGTAGGYFGGNMQGAGGGGGPGVGEPGGVSEFDAGSADVPVWGWLTGAGARRDASAAEIAAMRNENAWMNLARSAPTADDLTPEYGYESTTDEYGNLLGDPSQLEGMQLQGQEALTGYRGLMNGYGYTDADKAMQAANQQGAAQRLGAQNAATMQQAQARGMGGGGAELAARMGASEAMAGSSQQSDAMLQQAAMQRYLQSLSGYSSAAGQQNAQEMLRRNAIDAFNQNNTAWRRGRETRNTGTYNQQQNATTGARQQAYQNQEQAVAGATNQYSTDVSRRQNQGERQDAANANLVGTAGAILDAW